MDLDNNLLEDLFSIISTRTSDELISIAADVKTPFSISSVIKYLFNSDTSPKDKTDYIYKLYNQYYTNNVINTNTNMNVINVNYYG